MTGTMLDVKIGRDAALLRYQVAAQIRRAVAAATARTARAKAPYARAAWRYLPVAS